MVDLEPIVRAAANADAVAGSDGGAELAPSPPLRICRRSCHLSRRAVHRGQRLPERVRVPQSRQGRFTDGFHVE